MGDGYVGSSSSSAIAVTPVQFFSNDGSGAMAVHFWTVDDAYGPPALGELSLEDTTTADVGRNNDGQTRTQVVVIGKEHFTADPRDSRGTQPGHFGLSQWRPGHLMKKKNHPATDDDDPRRREQIRSTIHDLLEATSNPFALSASDALLNATKLCAELRCQATVEALMSSILPSWISLAVNRGSIAVAARIRYHGVAADDDCGSSSSMPILFQIMCDARTGSFVTAFPRSLKLLRLLASSGVPAASEPVALRIASLPPNRRRAAAGAHNASSNRVVRDAFDSLTRSMNLLGQRVGVGGQWDDKDDQSSRLRERSILSACGDVKAALVKCCGMAALYGLAPLALGAAVGLDAVPDMAGEVMDSVEGMTMLQAPPISILIDQELVETSAATSDGGKKKTSYIDQSLFSLSCAMDDKDGPVLLPFDVTVRLDNPTAFPQRTSVSLTKFKMPTTTATTTTIRSSSSNGDAVTNGDLNGRPLKRQKHETKGNAIGTSVMEEATRLSELLSIAIESEE